MKSRRGFTLLELTVALVVLGIAIAGLFPLMVVYSRALESLELRYTEEGNAQANWFCPVFTPNMTGTAIPREDYGVWYLVPSTDPWARKLGAMTTLSKDLPDPPDATMIDDGDGGYAETGTNWMGEQNTDAFAEYHRRHASATPPPIDYGVWTFTIANSGYYQILATWSAATDQANDACYEIHYDGNLLYKKGDVRQDVLPNGAQYQGHPWHVVATEYLQPGELKVKLRGGVTKDDDTETSGYVVADCVRIVPVEYTVHISSLDKSFDTEKVTAHVERIDP